MVILYEFVFQLLCCLLIIIIITSSFFFCKRMLFRSMNLFCIWRYDTVVENGANNRRKSFFLAYSTHMHMHIFVFKPSLDFQRSRFTKKEEEEMHVKTKFIQFQKVLLLPETGTNYRYNLNVIIAYTIKRSRIYTCLHYTYSYNKANRNPK